MQLLFIRKSSLGNLLIDDKINILEDLTFYLDLLDKNIKIGILNERLYNYVNNKNGITFSLSTSQGFLHIILYLRLTNGIILNMYDIRLWSVIFVHDS